MIELSDDAGSGHECDIPQMANQGLEEDSDSNSNSNDEDDVGGDREPASSLWKM